ncbi:hypothetical protein ACFO4E_26745 [Nocardiopsis mangrovi]|uniref:Uncharacterized protein n=1 Tax=Nocardiopsis mangrovi TaxID=1179818 RepID=A0ABV9E3G8_9ACTN
MGKWSLGIGAGLLVVSVLCVVLDLVPVGVIAGILGLVAVGMAGYDAVYEWLHRAELRRRGARAAARAAREREAREGR